MIPAAHIAVMAKAKSAMTSIGCSTFLAPIEMLRPFSEHVMDLRMFCWFQKDQILEPIIECITIFVMNNVTNRKETKNGTMFRYPSIFCLSESVPISVFARSDSYRAKRIFRWPTFATMSAPLCSAFRRARNTAQRSIAFENLPTNLAITEVLSHATE